MTIELKKIGVSDADIEPLQAGLQASVPESAPSGGERGWKCFRDGEARTPDTSSCWEMP